MKYLLSLFLLTISLSSFGQHAGDLDSTFGNNGIVVLNHNTTGNAVAIQPDDKIITVGQMGYDGAIFRFNINGSLDATFATGGIDTPTFAGSVLEAVALCSNGNIFSAGVGNNLNEDFFSMRALPAGNLDNSYNGDGTQLTDFQHNDDVCYSTAVQPDGKSLLGGLVEYYSGLIRYNDNGTIDSSFGTNGKVIINSSVLPAIGIYVRKIMLQPDGKIIACGTAGFSGQTKFALFRYDADGTLDNSFGMNGVVTTALNNSTGNSAMTATLLASGEILVAGTSDQPTTGYDFSLAEYQVNGSLDSNFGTNGIVTTDMGTDSADQATAIAVQADGKIVLGGVSGEQNNIFALARYEANGTLDTSFGNGGKVVTSLLSHNELNGIGMQSDGKIIVIGSVTDTVSNNAINHHLVVARYLAESHVAVPEIEKEQFFSVYPNPGNGVFTIIAKGYTGKAMIEVTDMQGKLIAIFPHDFSAFDKTQLNLKSYPSGVYNITINEQNKSEYLKIINNNSR